MTITGSQGVDCASPPPCAYTLTVFCVFFFFLSGSQLSAICPCTDSSTYLGAAAQLVNVDSRLGLQLFKCFVGFEAKLESFYCYFHEAIKGKGKECDSPVFFFKHSTYILPKLMYFVELIQDQMWHVN